MRILLAVLTLLTASALVPTAAAADDVLPPPPACVTVDPWYLGVTVDVEYCYQSAMAIVRAVLRIVCQTGSQLHPYWEPCGNEGSA